MMEYWNVDLNKEVTHFNASLSRGILPIPHPVHYKFTLSPIFPEPLSADRQALFHHSSIPVFQLCLPAISCASGAGRRVALACPLVPRSGRRAQARRAGAKRAKFLPWLPYVFQMEEYSLPVFLSFLPFISQES